MWLSGGPARSRAQVREMPQQWQQQCVCVCVCVCVSLCRGGGADAQAEARPSSVVLVKRRRSSSRGSHIVREAILTDDNCRLVFTSWTLLCRGTLWPG